MKTLAVIDADIVLYKTCSMVETPTDWGNDIWTLHADAREAKMAVDSEIASLKEATGASKCVLCFTAQNNWRAAVLPEYKANRKSTRKPVCFGAVKQYVLKNYDTMTEADLEADDCLGLIATGPKTRWRGCQRVVMISEDKDLMSIPGNLYNPRTESQRVITKDEADRFHLYQTLVGDPVDNYSGCPGIGPVKAQRLLDDSATWETVVAAYKDAGLTEDDALTQGRIARILRHREYNFRTKEVNLWNPRTVRSRTRARAKSSTPVPSETPE
jgi:DNA polymerase-1